MLNREEQRKALQLFMTDSGMIENALDRMEHQQRNLKAGDNVIHLSYSGSIIPEEDILKLEKQLEGAGFKLSYISTDGEIRGNFLDISNEVLFQLALGVAGGTVYDILKTFTLWMWEQGKTKLITRFQSKTVTKYQPITAIVVSVKKYKSITYVLPNDLPSKTVKKAIDNLMEATQIHQKMYGGKVAYYEYYKLQKNGLWKHFKFEASKKQMKRSKELIKQIMKKAKS